MSKQDAFKGVSVGDVLAGKYRVEKILGMGGMGVVVAATHLDLRELRAIKLIRPDAESDQSVERFLREARAVVRLRSEHVAEVYDVGRLETGAPYIVMELLEGQDLSAILKARGPLPIEEAVLYVTQACHALAEAHAAGLVHRDLKPGNLFVTRRADGSACVKVLDFGISKDTKPNRPDPEMTGAKDLMGSPLYMSPEQMRSARKVDARADVWALGAILYKLLTGRAPFQAPTVPEIFAATLGKAAKPPSIMRPHIPAALDSIILRCLDKQLQNRFSNAAELGAALMPHGPWEPSQTDSANALFRATGRRSTIPPEAPLPVLPIELPDYDVPPASPDPPKSYPEFGEPMSGLARSNNLGKPLTNPSWGSRTRSPVRASWIAAVLALSIVSALAGATFVAFVARMPAQSMVAAGHGVSTEAIELRLPELMPPPLPNNVPLVVPEPPATALAIAEPNPTVAPAIGSAARIKRRPARPSASARPLSSSETKGLLLVPDKPESTPRESGKPFHGRD